MREILNLLLDTHVLLWYLEESDRLRPETVQLVNDPRNVVFVSVASAWEIAIKKSLGKLYIPDNIGDWLPEQLTINRMTSLDITLAHAAGIEQLPLHHADPFDRLLISQARSDRLTILTADPLFQRYEVPVVRC